MKSQKNRSKALEAINDEHANELNDQLEKFLDLEALAKSQGGKLLIKNARKDVIYAIERLANGYADHTHPQLLAFCATLKSKLDLMRTLTRAKTNKELTEKELDTLIADALDE